MIEIITEEVEMPNVNDRRYQYNPKDSSGRKWIVTDTLENTVRYKGGYQNCAIACHNLNKKYYRDLKTNTHVKE